MLEIIEAKTKENFSIVRKLFEEYADSLEIDLAFQNHEQELAGLEFIYGPPVGALFLALWEGSPAGCIGLKKLDRLTCEMKRLYVKPEARGRGIGETLCRRIIKKAKELGYKQMRLDTLPSMSAAQTLYGKLGFKKIEPYYHNPYPGATYMELTLQSSFKLLNNPEPK
ncbi:MAG: GNAT family N-acetyltransferase [Candidatus Aminicenantes bacterium]|nr:GNAT family N-acetyltransferase [Candidatus Aminicenantes bacterium]